MAAGLVRHYQVAVLQLTTTIKKLGAYRISDHGPLTGVRFSHSNSHVMYTFPSRGSVYSGRRRPPAERSAIVPSLRIYFSLSVLSWYISGLSEVPPGHLLIQILAGENLFPLVPSFVLCARACVCTQSTLHRGRARRIHIHSPTRLRPKQPALLDATGVRHYDTLLNRKSSAARATVYCTRQDVRARASLGPTGNTLRAVQ